MFVKLTTYSLVMVAQATQVQGPHSNRISALSHSAGVQATIVQGRGGQPELRRLVGIRDIVRGARLPTFRIASAKANKEANKFLEQNDARGGTEVHDGTKYTLEKDDVKEVYSGAQKHVDEILAQFLHLYQNIDKVQDTGFWFKIDQDPVVDYLMTDHKIHSLVFLGFMIHTFLYFADLLLHLLPTGTVGWWVRNLLFGSSLLGDFAINLIAIFATYSVQAAESAINGPQRWSKKINGPQVWSKKYYLMGVIFTAIQFLYFLISVVTFGPLRLIKKYVLDYLFEFIRFVNWACVPFYVTIHVLWLDDNVLEYIGKAFENLENIRPENLLNRVSKVHEYQTAAN